MKFKAKRDHWVRVYADSGYDDILLGCGEIFTPNFSIVVESHFHADVTAKILIPFDLSAMEWYAKHAEGLLC